MLWVQRLAPKAARLLHAQIVLLKSMAMGIGAAVSKLVLHAVEIEEFVGNGGAS